MRLLEHCPVTFPPTKQWKVTHPVALLPNFAYKNSSPKTIKEFGLEYEPTSSCLSLAIEESLLQTPTFWFLWTLCVRHTNLDSITKVLQSSEQALHITEASMRISCHVCEDDKFRNPSLNLLKQITAGLHILSPR